MVPPPWPAVRRSRQYHPAARNRAGDRREPEDNRFDLDRPVVSAGPQRVDDGDGAVLAGGKLPVLADVAGQARVSDTDRRVRRGAMLVVHADEFIEGQRVVGYGSPVAGAAHVRFRAAGDIYR